MPKVEKCRICGSNDLHFFLRLGKTPLANNFIKPEKADEKEAAYPLEVCLCKNCGLVQLGYVVPPEIMFKEYIYFSSTSETIRAHFASLASEVLEQFSRKNDLIVEIASNDGVLLKNFLGRDIRALGVEPATNVAAVANKAGVETLNEFFNSKTAKRILAERGSASAIIANNVFAHIPDLHDFADGLRTLLAPDGTLIIEFPYLCDLYENLEFDTVYHEHLSYYSLKPVMHLFEKYGMELFDARKFPVHGGTMRIYAQKKGGRHPVNKERLKGFLARERKLGLYSTESWDAFAKRVENLKIDLVSMLLRLKKEGKKIAIYSAPAKGNTLLNYCRIGNEVVDYAVDKSQHKQGLLTPGMRIRVFGLNMLEERKPDYLLILAWNFADEIMKQQADFKKAGGHFIIPVPSPRII